jgi:hypothetical protein
MERIEAEIRKQLELFLTHEAVALALDEWTDPVCARIRGAPFQLTAFVRFLRARLTAGESIADTAGLAKQFLCKLPRLPKPRETVPWSWEAPPPLMPIIVSLGPILSEEAALKAKAGAWLQDSLLELSGILVPRFEFRIDISLQKNSFQFTIGDRQSQPEEGLQFGEIWIFANPESLPAEWEPRARSRGAVCHASADQVRAWLPSANVLDGEAFMWYELGFQLVYNLVLCIDEVQVEHRLALIAPYPADPGRMRSYTLWAGGVGFPPPRLVRG